ncbi:hypothetical protein [Amaricoccus sp.]|uniref:hypothetical protein n=1 Tax=Amaricoccus sp. TaxID=1872485 RepID=UPI001B5C2AF9|nr:hypothetical protein [Amaricoccus sp.]MBP7241877.1 hypothetical protein [Amaricoccus sp.]
MRRSRALGLAVGALALAGCASGGLPLQPTAVVPAQPGMTAQGQADVVVRTFAATPDGERSEVGGAVCKVDSILFHTRLRSPARVVFPSFGPQSPTLGVACEANGWKGVAEQGVVIRWVSAPGAWPGPGPWPYYGPGPWGWGGGWGWDNWGAPSVPTFVYPDIHVTLAPPAGGQGGRLAAELGAVDVLQE